MGIGTVDQHGILVTVQVKDIVDSPFQNREDFGNVQELAEDIAVNGLLMKPLVRPLKNGKYELVHGHRRVRAIQQLGRKTVECFVKDLSDIDAYRIHISENGQRQDLSPIEEARLYVKFREFLESLYGRAVNCAELGKLLNSNECAVGNKLDLLCLPEDLQARIHNREIPFDIVRNLLCLLRKERNSFGKPLEKTTEYLPQIRSLMDEVVRGRIKTREGISEAANKIKNGLAFEEAIRQARVGEAFRESQRLLVGGKEPEDILRSILNSQPDIRDDILNANIDLLQKMLRSHFILCPHCGKPDLVWGCCGKEVVQNE